MNTLHKQIIIVSISILLFLIMGIVYGVYRKELFNGEEFSIFGGILHLCIVGNMGYIGHAIHKLCKSQKKEGYHDGIEQATLLIEGVIETRRASDKTEKILYCLRDGLMPMIKEEKQCSEIYTGMMAGDMRHRNISCSSTLVKKIQELRNELDGN